MKVGDLVKIKQSFSQKAIGKKAIVVERWGHWSVTIAFLDTGERKHHDTRKLEVISESR